MPELKQKNIEQYFEKYGIEDSEEKTKLLPKITSLIHDRNKLVIDHEKAEEEYRKEQIKNDIKELEETIQEKFENFANKN